MFETLFYIMSSLLAGNALVNPAESTVNEQNAGSPTGGAPQTGTGPLNQQPDQLQQEFMNFLGGGQSAPGLQNATDTAANAAESVAAASAVTPSSPELVGKGEAAKYPGGKEAPAPEAGPEIGAVLAAIPQALQAVNMLFAGSQDQYSTRPAPIAGGQPGRPVGQFAQPYGQAAPNDIGRLLAALPGIR